MAFSSWSWFSAQIREWSKHPERLELSFYIFFLKDSCLSMSPCIAGTKIKAFTYSINTSSFSPMSNSLEDSHPHAHQGQSVNSSDLSRLQMETWKVGVFRYINALNIHVPGVNQLYSEHWQRPSQELLLLLDVVSSLLLHRDFLGLLGNQSGLPASSLKNSHVKVSTSAGILYRWNISAISAISTAKLLYLWKAETWAEVQMDNTDCEAVWRWKSCLRNGELAWLKGKRCFENLLLMFLASLSRWFLTAACWIHSCKGSHYCRTFQVTLHSFWFCHQQLLRWAEMSSLFPPGKSNWSNHPSGYWVEAQEERMGKSLLFPVLCNI